MSSSARLLLGVILSLAGMTGGRLLRRRVVCCEDDGGTEADIPTTDFRRGIFDGDGGRRGRGAVVGLTEELRRLGGIVCWREGDDNERCCWW
jgi:hypothetical protein